MIRSKQKEIEQEINKVATIVRNYINEATAIGYGQTNNLLEAIRYSTLSEGKMIRAYLVYSFCKILDVNNITFIHIAAAVELIHAYSLIHDDLPAMDDDEIRRGQDSCHIKYDQATAILAGDAIQSLAFEIITRAANPGNCNSILKIINNLAESIGHNGMAGGQYLDLNTENNQNLAQIIHMQKLKTGKLIEFACNAPILIAQPCQEVTKAIMNFAHDIGFIYQIKDDLLDIKGLKKDMGKNVGKDAKKGKKNLVHILGVEKAEKQLLQLANQAKKHLNIFDKQATNLHLFTDYIIARKK